MISLFLILYIIAFLYAAEHGFEVILVSFSAYGADVPGTGAIRDTFRCDERFFFFWVACGFCLFHFFPFLMPYIECEWCLPNHKLCCISPVRRRLVFVGLLLVFEWFLLLRIKFAAVWVLADRGCIPVDRIWVVSAYGIALFQSIIKSFCKAFVSQNTVVIGHVFILWNDCQFIRRHDDHI